MANFIPHETIICDFPWINNRINKLILETVSTKIIEKKKLYSNFWKINAFAEEVTSGCEGIEGYLLIKFV